MIDFMSRLKDSGQKHFDNKNSGGTKRRRFVPGIEIVGRLLPYINASTGDLRFTEQHLNHYFLGGDNKWNFLTCPKQGNGVQLNWDAPCPFCEAMVARYKELGTADRTYNNYKRKKKIKVNFLLTSVNVVPGYTVDDEDKEVWSAEIGKIIVLDMPVSLNDKIEAAWADQDLGMAIFAPENGFDFRIKCTTKSKGKGSTEQMIDYSLSDFARKDSSVCEPGQSEAFIAGCADIGEQLRLLAVADASRVVSAAEAEGIIASSAPPPSNESNEPEERPKAETPTSSVSDLFDMYMNK